MLAVHGQVSRWMHMVNMSMVYTWVETHFIHSFCIALNKHLRWLIKIHMMHNTSYQHYIYYQHFIRKQYNRGIQHTFHQLPHLCTLCVTSRSSTSARLAVGWVRTRGTSFNASEPLRPHSLLWPRPPGPAVCRLLLLQAPPLDDPCHVLLLLQAVL